MALPNLEAQVRTVSEAAQTFVDAYYEALNKRRDTSAFYASASPKLTAAGVVPDISINGHVVPPGGGGSDPAAAPRLAQSLLFESRGPHVHYEVGGFDAHPVNANYAVGADAANNSGSNLSSRSERISFAVQVSGAVKFGKAGDDGFVEQAFSEAWLLVPHWEAQGPKAARGLKRWLVASQNFRTL
ncbi:NTF2-related export protein 1/2 [Microdochium nivale]|nr:NTF2-related export protein 1/2 [Microdochium nivale]